MSLREISFAAVQRRTMKEPIFLAIDIEKAGNTYQHALLAVGFCVGDFTTGVLEKHTWCCRPEGDFELLRIYELWSKNLSVLERIDKESKPLQVQMNNIARFLHEFDRHYPPEIYEVTILSHDPAFVIGHFDHHFCTKTGELPLRYSRANKYHSVEDPYGRLEVLRLIGTSN
jgi:hypothetical protein